LIRLSTRLSSTEGRIRNWRSNTRSLNRVKQTRKSVIRMNDRHFTEPFDERSGAAMSFRGGITLKDIPAGVFSSLR
jgi:hypothetical protein